MKTHKHGKGMTHEQVVTFSNRLAAQAQTKISPNYYSHRYSRAYEEGWAAACKYFAHQLRKKLRECENSFESYLERLKEEEEL